MSPTPGRPQQPINWTVTATVFFLGSVLLWADRTNFSVAAAAWAKEFGWTPEDVSGMTIGQILLYLEMSHNEQRLADAAT